MNPGLWSHFPPKITREFLSAIHVSELSGDHSSKIQVQGFQKVQKLSQVKNEPEKRRQSEVLGSTVPQRFLHHQHEPIQVHQLRLNFRMEMRVQADKL